jgi:hypothetical protein
MGKTRLEMREGERVRRRRGDSMALSVPLFAITIVITSLVAGGCNGVHKAQGDPLFGGVKPQPGLTGAANTPLPPLPGPTTTASTAALASVNPRPLDGSHVRIPDSASTPAAASGQGFGPSGTQLQQPVTGALPAPGFAPVSRQGQTVANPGAMAGSSNLSYEEAQARLTARGVNWQRLETWGDQGDWKFTCSIPNKQNPYISRTYEAEAHDPLSAIHGVLDQLEHDQR